METTKMSYKDYQYGWFGFHASYSGMFMGVADCHNYKHDAYKIGYRSNYTGNRSNTLKQLPRIKDVVFVYGDYKDVIQ